MKKLLLTLAALGLLLPAAVQAQTPPSPVGDWDLVYSGRQRGLAVLSFQSDFTFTGYEILRPTPPPTPKPADPDPNPRPTSGRVGDSITTGGSGGATTVTNLLGSAPISGTWGYDVRGKLIGILNQLSLTVKTLEVVTTNIIDNVPVYSTNLVDTLVTETNAVSFRGTVVPGKRMTLALSGQNGNNSLAGLPVIPLADQSGPFYVTGRRGTVSFVEFLDVTPDPLMLNRYNYTGTGAGYTFQGRMLVSRQGRIAITAFTNDEEPVLTVYTGQYDRTRRRGELRGTDTLDHNHVVYKLFHQ